ncbi:MAG: trigger factor [bacterium]
MERAVMENVKVNITDNKPCEVHLDVEIDASEVHKERDIVFNEIVKQAKMPGFRQGKAPMDIIKKTYHDQAKKQVIDNLISRFIPVVLQENNIQPADYPQIQKFDFDFEKNFTMQVKVEKQPDVKVKEYKKINIKKKLYPVNDEQINEQMNALLDKNARLVAQADAAASRQNFVVVDYAGSFEGKPVQGTEAKNQLLDLNSPQMIKGFSDGIVGAKAGEERKVEVEMPAEYPQKELAGKKVLFTIKINEIKKKILPNCDDEFAKDIGFKTLDELKQRITSELEAQSRQKTAKEIKNQIIEHLLKYNIFPVPQSMVTEHEKTLLEQSHKHFLSYGYSETEWEKQKDAMMEKLRSEAERQVRLSYILSAVSAVEKLEVTEQDLNAEFEKLKQRYPDKEKETKMYFDKHKESISSNKKEEKIFTFLTDHAKIKIEK